MHGEWKCRSGQQDIQQPADQTGSRIEVRGKDCWYHPYHDVAKNSSDYSGKNSGKYDSYGTGTVHEPFRSPKGGEYPKTYGIADRNKMPPSDDLWSEEEHQDSGNDADDQIAFVFVGCNRSRPQQDIPEDASANPDSAGEHHDTEKIELVPDSPYSTRYGENTRAEEVEDIHDR